jgi:hypothetical protein
VTDRYEVITFREAWQGRNDPPAGWAVRRYHDRGREIVAWHKSYFAARFDAEKRNAKAQP